MKQRCLSAPELSLYLETQAPAVGDLGPEDRAAVLRIAQRLAQRGLPLRFILATVRSTIELLRTPPTAAPSPTPAEARADERHIAARRLAEHTRATLREARAARRSNEVRRMRCVLRSIDRSRLRDTLGEEGGNLIREIDHTLDRLDTPVRRGRPRSHRLMV
ncbi:MAG: hypothetical protein GX774_18370 [Armatimonadetes bacterium]|jgi:hypothetical protein|nr:hypothetical protein [Armatimonadota bacterium]